MSWLIVTPAFDEADRLPAQAASLAAQTAREVIGLWVVVDDGSSDGTATCVAWSELPFPVTVLTRDNTGGLAGASELLAFRAGVERGLELLPSPERIMKLDADLVLAPDYFELLEPYGDDVGLVGGRYLGRGELSSSEHVRGGLRAYSPAAYATAREVAAALGWDVVDEVAIRMDGRRTVMDPRATARSSRVTGGSLGLLRGRYRKGIASRWSGYHPAYAGLQVLLHLFRSPFLIGGVALAWGYVSAGRGPHPTELRRAMRRDQTTRLRALARSPLRWTRTAYTSSRS